MAEIVNLFEVNIDTDKAVKDLAASQKAVDDLKKEIKELQKAEGDNSIAIAESTAELKNEQAELRTNTRLTQNAIKTQKAANGSIEDLRARLAVASIQWQRLTEEERENTEEGQKLIKQKKELTEALRAEEKATGDSRRGVGDYAGGIKEAIESSTGFNTSLLTLAANPVVLTITAIVGLFKLFQQAAGRSEEASENLNKILAVFQGVLDGILNALVPIVEFLSDKLVAAFENPKQAIADLGELIKENLINRLESFLVLGEAFSALLDGDFKKAAKLGADAAIQFATGVEDGTDKLLQAGEAVVEFGENVVEESNKAIEANKALANSQRELLRISKQFELQQLRSQKLAEDQRQIRDDEAKSIEDRIFANQELGRILDEQFDKELKLANAQLRFAELRKQADGDTLETQEAIFDAQIKIAEIEERIAGQRSEQLTNTNALLKEQEELEVAAIERQIELEDEALAREIERAMLATEAEKERFSNLQEARVLDAENKRALQEQTILVELDNERARLETLRAQEIAFAEKIGADVNLVNQKYQKANIALDKAEFQAKAALAGDFAQNIATIAGEGTAVGKAAAVASATINTYQAATAAFASLAPIPIVGPALGAAAAGAAVVSGLANVKKILSVKSGLPGESNVSGGGGGSPSIPSAPPTSTRANVADDINAGIVSRSTSEIGQGDNISLQPTLVTDEVTVSQNQEAANNQTGTV